MEVNDAGVWRDACLKTTCYLLVQQLGYKVANKERKEWKGKG